MRKQALAVLLCIALFLCSVLSVLAADGNMDGDGGGMEGGESGVNTWSPGYDGIRVSVVNKNTKQVAGNVFDWTTVSPSSSIISFSKRNKLQYQNGAVLAPIAGTYAYLPAPSNMPSIISTNGSSNIVAVKSFFTDEEVIQCIAKDANLSYNTLISGDFVIMLEPVAYLTYNGNNFAMTATEAALYDRLVGGGLKSKMGFLTHQNLPLSMYLEKTELGISPWSGGSGVISNENIIAYLGVGTVRFDDLEDEEQSPPDEEDEEAFYDYTYYADTDVVTAIWIDSGGRITPDHGATARFSIPGQGSVYKSYVIPAGESQLVWVKWRTPDEDTTLTITVNASHGTTRKASIRVKIIKPEENTPPDPQGRDRNDSFKLKSPPSGENVTSLSWGEWYAWWESDWVYISGDEGKSGHWEDHGDWEFGWNSYSASLSASVKLQPDEQAPTATGNYNSYTMKSGYGIQADVTTNFSTNGGSGNTAASQHIIATFPEFDYETYNRFLEPEGNMGNSETWHFKENEYAQFGNAVHFTPIWYPDGKKFPVVFEVLDAWTPAGQLKMTIVAENITVDGNVYQDWHIAPGYVS